MVFVSQGAPGACKYQKKSLHTLYIGFVNEIDDYSIFCSICESGSQSLKKSPLRMEFIFQKCESVT